MKTKHPFAVFLTVALGATAVTTWCQCGSGEDGADPQPGPASATPAQQPGPGTAPAPTVLGERVHVVLSGSMEGRLEPCGCASGQLGGLPRRIVYLQEIHGADLLLEGGDLGGGSTPLDLEKAFTAIGVLFGMVELTRYDALGTGPRDLELPLDKWGSYLTDYQAPVLAADLEPLSTQFKPRAFVEKQVRNSKVRVVSLVMALPPALAAAEPPPLRLLDPADGWRRGLEGAADETLRVLMVHTDPEHARALARDLRPRPDLMIAVGDGVHEPPPEPEYRHDVPIVYPGIRGRFLVDLWFGRTDHGGAIPRYEIVPLRGSETKPDAGQDPAVREMLRQHRVFVAEEQLREKMADQRPTANGSDYVGNAACGKCHETDYLLWKNSKHGRAWDTLVRAEQDPKRYGWPVTHYPDCVGCHVVGYGEKTGFVAPETTPELANVGCERCHGAGSAHAANPQAAKMGKVGAGLPSTVCTECHDFEQSPDFDYGRRWSIIAHGQRK